MGIIDTSIKRPVFTTMVYIAIFMLGVIGLSKMSVDFMPDIDFPAITIITQQTGVGPEEIESSITRIIEGAVATAEGIDKLTASSQEGLSVVSVMFKWGHNLDAAVADLRDKLDLVRDKLPDDATKPTIFRINTSSIPVAFLALKGNKSLSYLYEYADDKLKDKLVQVPGIASIDIQGARKRQVQVVLDRNRLDAYGMTPSQIIGVLKAENINASGGTLKSGYSQFTLRTQGEFKTLEDVRNVIITHQNGVPVYLRYIAEVNWGISEETATARFDGKAGLRLVVYKQSGANTVQAVDQLRLQIENIRKDLPPGVELTEAFNTADFIKNSIGSTSEAAIVGGILAIFVVLFFLRNIRASLIIGLSIPISMLATFIGMYFFGVNLNTISLAGLALGIGMVVDNAIIVLENTFSYMARGQKSTEAARIGTQEMFVAILSTTLTHICVFLPIIFTEGMAKELFSDISLTVTFSLLASLLVAVTLVPMLNAKYLRYYDDSTLKRMEPRLYKVVSYGGRLLDTLDSKYKEGIRWALVHRKKVVWSVLAIFLFTMFVVSRGIESEFMPESDDGSIRLDLTMPVGTRLETTNEATEQLISLMRGILPQKEILTIFFSSGSSSGISAVFQQSGSHVANLRVKLVNKKLRETGTRDYIKKFKKALAGMPAPLGVAVVNMTASSGMMMSSGSPIDILVRGYDLKKGSEIAKQLKSLMDKVPGLYNVDVSRKEGSPEISIQVDRAKAASMGITVSSVASAVQQSVLGVTATYLREEGRELDILVRLDERDRKTIEDIENIQVLSPYTQKPVRVGAVARIVRDTGPVKIERYDQERVVHVTAYSFRGLQESVNDIKAEVAKNLALPDGFSLQYEGSFKDMQSSFGDLALAMLLGIVLIYAVMASIFESYLDPFIILFTIPLALIGVIWILFLTGTSLNVNGMVGMLVLLGVVVSNGIVLINYINLLRKRGYKLEEAIMEGGRRRLRPILMTSLTLILAMIPSAVGMGEGDETSIPMARVVIGGLTASMILMLFVVPCLYLMFDHISEKIRKKRANRKPMLKMLFKKLLNARSGR